MPALFTGARVPLLIVGSRTVLSKCSWASDASRRRKAGSHQRADGSRLQSGTTTRLFRRHRFTGRDGGSRQHLAKTTAHGFPLEHGRALWRAYQAVWRACQAVWRVYPVCDEAIGVRLGDSSNHVSHGRRGRGRTLLKLRCLKPHNRTLKERMAKHAQDKIFSGIQGEASRCHW